MRSVAAAVLMSVSPYQSRRARRKNHRAPSFITPAISSALGDDDFEVLAGDDERAVLGEVELVDQREQVGLELLLRGRIDRAECLVRRPVIGAEDVEEMRRRLVAESEIPALRRNADATAEYLLEIFLPAPHDRRLHARRRRHEFHDGLEQISDEAIGCPVGKADLAAGAADAD